jgi:hypothetical protein
MLRNAAADAQQLRRLGRCAEATHQRRLADTRLAGDEDDPRRAVQHLLPALMQEGGLALPSDEQCVRRLVASTRVFHRLCDGIGQCVRDAHRRREAVAAPCDALDPLGLAVTGTEHRAQRVDDVGHRVWADMQALPAAIQQLVDGDHLPRPRR